MKDLDTEASESAQYREEYQKLRPQDRQQLRRAINQIMQLLQQSPTYKIYGLIQDEFGRPRHRETALIRWSGVYDKTYGVTWEVDLGFNKTCYQAIATVSGDRKIVASGPTALFRKSDPDGGFDRLIVDMFHECRMQRDERRKRHYG